MNLRLLLLFIIGALVSLQMRCAQAPAPQAACGYVQNSLGQRVSWKNGGPINLYYDAGFPSQYYPAVQNAVATWEKTIGHKMFNLAGSLPASTPAQDGVSVIYWMKTWDPTLTQQQANTTIYWQDDRITEADVRVNAQNYTFSTNPGATDVDMESLILHELGHTLGLKHDDATPSVMATFLSSDYQRRTLYSADVASVGCEYK